jgi:hypothetical protein
MSIKIYSTRIGFRHLSFKTDCVGTCEIVGGFLVLLGLRTRSWPPRFNSDSSCSGRRRVRKNGGSGETPPRVLVFCYGR